MKNSLKVFIMAIVAFVGSIISTSGIPSGKTGWLVLGVTTVCFLLSYIAKNKWLPSNQIFDVIGALLMAISVGVSNWLATLAADTPFDWNVLWKLVVSVVVGYFSKNALDSNKSLSPNKQ